MHAFYHLPPSPACATKAERAYQTMVLSSRNEKAPVTVTGAWNWRQELSHLSVLQPEPSDAYDACAL